MTPHTRNFSQSGYLRRGGIVGQTIVVDDVKKDSRYLACSLETKSEIRRTGVCARQVAGELDIDSHFAAAFGEEDRNWWNIVPSLWASEWRKTEPSQLLASGC